MSSLALSAKSWMVTRDHSITPLGCWITFWIKPPPSCSSSSMIFWRLIISFLSLRCFFLALQEIVFRTPVVGTSSLHPESSTVSSSSPSFSRYRERGSFEVNVVAMTSLCVPRTGLLFNSSRLCLTQSPWKVTIAFNEDSLSTFTSTHTGQSSNIQYPKQVKSGVSLDDIIGLTLWRLNAKLQ